MCNKVTKGPFDAQDRGLPASLHKTFTSSHTFVTVPNIFFSLVMSLNFSFHECFKYSGSNLFISLISWSSYFWLEELKSSIEPFQVSFEGVKMWFIVLGEKKVQTVFDLRARAMLLEAITSLFFLNCTLNLCLAEHRVSLVYSLWSNVEYC